MSFWISGVSLLKNRINKLGVYLVRLIFVCFFLFLVCSLFCCCPMAGHERCLPRMKHRNVHFWLYESWIASFPVMFFILGRMRGKSVCVNSILQNQIARLWSFCSSESCHVIICTFWKKNACFVHEVLYFLNYLWQCFWITAAVLSK